MEAAGRRRELVERANFFEQRAIEYLRPQSREGWGGPDGVWAPFEERGDARQSGRSAGRLESIDCYRWPRIRSRVLCYPILLHGLPFTPTRSSRAACSSPRTRRD